MIDMSGRRLKRGEKVLHRRLKEEELLYPTVEVTLSPADIDYYRSLGPWALALDRQSKSAELTREQATGNANRVRNCLALAREMNLALPEPRENQNRREGELQFVFDEAPASYHWFADGVLGDASGYTASPKARLKLWQAAKTCRLLRDHGCGPRAVVIGEVTRFFRDQRQFLDWYHILKDSGAIVRIYGCPELTPETEEMFLPTYLSSVGALSQWLKRQTQMSRETFRATKRLFATRAPFGLLFNLDPASPGYRRQVFPHPIEWPLLREWIDRIYEGEFRGKGAAVAWLHGEALARGAAPQRVPTSHTWVSLFLASEIPEGVYQQYKARYLPCKAEDAAMKSDWDLTPKGKRRYLAEPTPDLSVAFPILCPPEELISRERLLVARAQFRGRPLAAGPSAQPKAASLRAAFETALLRRGTIHCAACGCVVHEMAPRRAEKPGDVAWTRAEDEWLLDRVHEGWTSAQIAAHLGCPVTRVEHRRSTMKLRGKDREAEARALADWWADPFRRRMACWHLYCRCLHEIQTKTGEPLSVVRERPEAQHPRKRNGSLTLPLEQLVWAALRQDPRLEPWSETPQPVVDLSVLEAEEIRLAHLIRRIQDAYEAEDWTFYMRDEAPLRLAELRQQRAQVSAKIAAAKGSWLDQNDRQEALAWEETRAMLCRMLEHPRFLESLEFRRKVMELCVKRVIVNLTTGAFVAETEFRAESLRRLSGQVLLAEVASSENAPGLACSSYIACYLRGQVLLAA